MRPGFYGWLLIFSLIYFILFGLHELGLIP